MLEEELHPGRLLRGASEDGCSSKVCKPSSWYWATAGYLSTIPHVCLLPDCSEHGGWTATAIQRQ
jgi:hypothetical protein